MKHLLSLSGLLSVLALLLGGCSDDNPAETDPRTRTPDFILEDVEGHAFQLSQQQGKVVLLHFFSPGCAVCRSEVTELNALQEALGDDGLLVAGIAIGTPDPEAVRTFADVHGVRYRLLLDNGVVSLGYGVTAVVPVTFVVDREGWIVGQFEGFFPEEDFAGFIEPLL